MGEDKLCTVCKEYPRYAEQFGDIIEKGIGLSCEEAGRIIFSDKNPVRFIDEAVSYTHLDVYKRQYMDLRCLL